MSHQQVSFDHGLPRAPDLPSIRSTSLSDPSAPNVIATLTGITSIAALAAVPAAQYASVAWARGRWLVGQAPTHVTGAHLDSLQAELRVGTRPWRRAVAIKDVARGYV
jgi:hypothetical protein